MEIQIHYDYRESDLRDLLPLEELVIHVLAHEDVASNSEVAITFVDEKTIHNLNREYRQIDKPTDVLSFECDGFVDEFDDIVSGDPSIPFELGDIIVSVDRAESQAHDYGLTFAEEISLLVTHGLLHLCGYDHSEEEDACAMETREDELLSIFWHKPFKRSKIE